MFVFIRGSLKIFIMDFQNKAALAKSPEEWSWLAKIPPRHRNGANLTENPFHESSC